MPVHCIRISISQGEEDWVVFLFAKGENQGGGTQRQKPLPTNVQGIFKEPTIVLPFQVLVSLKIRGHQFVRIK